MLGPTNTSALFAALGREYPPVEFDPADTSGVAALLENYMDILEFKSDGVGRHVEQNYLSAMGGMRGHAVIVEVGVWLGGSLLQWLSDKRVLAIGIDPFIRPPSSSPPRDLSSLRARAHEDAVLWAGKLGRPLFNRQLVWRRLLSASGPPLTGRVILIPGWAPQDLSGVFASALKVDVVFIDGGKGNKHPHYPQSDASNDSSWAHRLVTSIKDLRRGLRDPVFAGDDWSWRRAGQKQQGVSMRAQQAALLNLADEWRWSLGVACGRTWILSPAGWSRSWGCGDPLGDCVWLKNGEGDAGVQRLRLRHRFSGASNCG